MLQPNCITCLPTVSAYLPPPSWNSTLATFETIVGTKRDGDEEFLVPLDPGLNVLEAPGKLVDSLLFDLKLVGKICGYASLGSNWDGEGAAPIKDDVVDDCLSFLAAIPADVGPPKVMPLRTGEVSLYWDRRSIYAEISFDGSHSFCAYAKGPETEPIYIDRSSIDAGQNIESFPKSIRALLTNTLFDFP